MPWCLAETRHFLSQYLSTIIEIPWHSLGSDFAVIFLNIFSTSSATKIYLTIAYPTSQSYFHKTNELIYRRFWVYWGQTFVLLLNANFPLNDDEEDIRRLSPRCNAVIGFTAALCHVWPPGPAGDCWGQAPSSRQPRPPREHCPLADSPRGGISKGPNPSRLLIISACIDCIRYGLTCGTSWSQDYLICGHRLPGQSHHTGVRSIQGNILPGAGRAPPASPHRQASQTTTSLLSA